MKKLNKRDFKYMHEPKYGVPDRYFTEAEEFEIQEAKKRGDRDIRINDETVGLGYGSRHIIKNPEYSNPDTELEELIDKKFKAEFYRQLSTTKDAIANGVPVNHYVGWPVDIKDDEWKYVSRDGENPVYDRWLIVSEPFLPKAIARITREAMEDPIFKKRYDEFQEYKDSLNSKKEMLYLKGNTTQPKPEQGKWDRMYSN